VYKLFEILELELSCLEGSWKQPKDTLLSIADTVRDLEEHFHCLYYKYVFKITVNTLSSQWSFISPFNEQSVDFHIAINKNVNSRVNVIFVVTLLSID